MSKFWEDQGRPALGKLTVGDPVVIVSSSYGHFMRTIPATVVKVARVWVTIAPDSVDLEQRFRMDTQESDSPYSDRDAFRTLAQQEWHEKLSAAEKVLREAWIEIRRGTRYDTLAFKIWLAQQVERAEQEGFES